VDVVCGGDFNCVEIEEIDRRGGTSKSDVGSREMKRFFQKWNLVDAGDYHRPIDRNPSACAEYAAKHHSHFHVAAGGKRGSPRLDRMYVSAAATQYVRGVETDEAQCISDHRAVLLEPHSPSGVLRTKNQMQLYPPPAYVRTATRSLNEQRLLQHRVDMQKHDARPIECWQEFKEMISGQMRELRKAANVRMTNGYRQRIQRIKASLARCQLGERVDDRRAALLEALQEAQEQRRALKRRTQMARTTWSADTTTKQFYKRICTKFGDNTIRTLIPTQTGRARAQHDKANALRDSWEEIFNGEVSGCVQSRELDSSLPQSQQDGRLVG
jgi:hypothetical protein